ncbi:MAG: helix-turn-helix domain-containing protein [Solirubrobacteraceae bacterium]
MAHASRLVGDADKNLSSSLLLGLLVLVAFPPDGTLIGNAEVARALGMNPSTAHRYISTLVAVGLLERDPDTRTYRLAI